MEVPPQLEVAVDLSDLEIARSVTAAHGRSLTVWLNGWRSQLVHFRSESVMPKERWTDQTQHRHDWVGLLFIRDFIEKAINDQTAEIPRSVIVWLSQVDDFMRSFTEVVPAWNPDSKPGEAWWWSRLPTKGPVRAGWWAGA